jgi:ribosomal protein S18 acetylase RimI-like enzyme
LAELLARARALGFGRLRLDTAPELLEAQALYRRFGFAPIPQYRSGLLPDALCFEVDLTLRVLDGAGSGGRQA